MYLYSIIYKQFVILFIYTSVLIIGAGYHSRSTSKELQAHCRAACTRVRHRTHFGQANDSFYFVIWHALLFYPVPQAMKLLMEGKPSSEATAVAVAVLEVCGSVNDASSPLISLSVLCSTHRKKCKLVWLPR